MPLISHLERAHASYRHRDGRSHGKASIRATLVVSVVCLVFSAGCVQRRLIIRSQPPGAMVYVDDYQIGPTPIATSFTYYGTRKIRLVKDGYQTLTVYERIDPPWYQIPPIDFFAENVMGREVRDTRVLEYQLQPQPISPTQQLLDRAERLRRQTGGSPPLPAAVPVQETQPPAVSPGTPPAEGSTSPAYIIEPPRTSY